MNEFKAIDLSNDKKTIFHSWKVKEGSTLSIGKVIFLYENSTETASKSKTEQFKSNMSGVIVRQLSNFQRGEEITTETLLFTYEKCPHAIVINNMCGSCGEDLKGNAAPTPKYQLHHIRKAATIATDMSSTSSSEASRATTSSTTAASVSIVHTDPSIRVSEKLAQEIGKEDLVNLVNNRKLVLLVDLDHTLIHTTNEHVNPNIKKIHHYELMPRNVWYHTKFRPGCEHFIETMSKIYELHMVTFGEKSYAHKIAQLMDPERRYFHDRILSRNEIINPVSKADNLKSLFPRGDLMVCIIDDREDVWNYARNLICVQPYTYFKHTGDINDPSLFKQQQSPNATATTQQQQPRPNNGTRKRKLDETNNEETSGENSSSSNGGTGDAAATTAETSDQQQQQPQQEQIEPVDPDDYLEHLERILRTIHDEYYRIYENRVLSHNNNNNNNHHHHHHNESRRRNRINDIEESDLPDVKKILPMIKSRVLEGCVITFSGVVPTGYDLKKQRCYLMAKSLGARVNEELVVSSDEPATNNDADVEAFEALLEASIPTIKSNPAATTTTTTTTTNGGEETIPSSSSSSLTTTTTTTTTAPVINAFNRHKYEYRFEDEYDDSSSECSGGDYTNRSSDEDEDDETFDEDDGDEEKADIDETDELGEDSSSTTGSANNREQIVLKKIAHRIASAAAKKKKKNKRPTTHLVAAKYGTVKVYEAMKSKTPIKVVTPEWLINCNFKWLRCDENDFKLTKDYEYRNCIFHHDYNAH